MSTTPIYVPTQGDIVVFKKTAPTVGHEQHEDRPWMVLTPQIFNKASGLLLAAPITNQSKGLDMEVPVKGVAGVSGVVLTFQVRTLDWQSRGAILKGRASAAMVKQASSHVTAMVKYSPGG
ncbi:MAG: type II toxin-antitoxin system PemK/MazF family toxin [Acidobacteriota bacterium]|nr:type II toxin-antitoxin system PemK/MazF family toxin [Acidobacteriota bacterium]